MVIAMTIALIFCFTELFFIWLLLVELQRMQDELDKAISLEPIEPNRHYPGECSKTCLWAPEDIYDCYKEDE